MYKIILLIVLIFGVFGANAQQNYIDSLLHVVETTNNDTVKTNTYINIATSYQQSDTVKFLSYNKKALEIAKKINYKEGEADVYTTYGMFYSIYTDFDLAISYFEKAAVICKKNDFKESLVSALGNAGNVYCYIGNYNKGLRLQIQRIFLHLF